MNIFGKTLTPDEVFTPRSATVNGEMYISRQSLEEKLRDALNGSLHILIHGESGCGKSWLYKQILSSNNFHYVTINLSLASSMGSISGALKNVLDRDGGAKKIRYNEKKKAGLDAVVVSSELEHDGEYEIGQMEPFEACLKFCRKQAGNNNAAIVFDNLEAIFDNPELMSELGNIITLLDDSNYSKYRVRLIFVGVPSEVKAYFSKTPNRQTIANRLKELPEVGALKNEQVDEFVRKGFIENLCYTIVDGDEKLIASHINHVTLGIPQRLHEYCLELAQLAEKNGKLLSNQLCAIADKSWLESQLSNDYECIQSVMNERETRAQRRNQVLFSLGLLNGREFKNLDVEKIVRQEFPTSTGDTTLNVSQILSDLAGRETPIIKKASSKTEAYNFTDPRFKMCIRAMLKKNAENESVTIVDIGDI